MDASPGCAQPSIKTTVCVDGGRVSRLWGGPTAKRPHLIVGVEGFSGLKVHLEGGTTL